MLRLFFKSNHIPVSPIPHDNGTPSAEIHKKGANMDFFHRSSKENRSSKEKRHSLSGISLSSEGLKSNPKLGRKSSFPKLATLEIEMESPPLVMHGPPEQSSGALLSAKLKLNVADIGIQLTALDMKLLSKLTTRKPVSKDCQDCTTKTMEIMKWRFLTEPTTYMAGTHSFPFSFLLPGTLPATSHGKLATIDYSLVAQGVSDSCENIKLVHPILVQRALAPGVERTSIRIFPPTNITATVNLPTAIHPIGEFNVQMRMTGVVESESNYLRRWHIRKMSWRIDENSKMISPACPKHAHKIGAEGQEGKGILHEYSKILGEKEYYAGWKSDFEEIGGGSIEMDFVAVINHGSRPVCGVDSGTGFEVSHKLVVEIIVGEDRCSKAKTKPFVATGTARVLRMSFGIMVTERGGMGISWDKEQPPMYENVPSSPPRYATVDDYNGKPLPYEELESLPH
ncbi:hypothetical protein MMC14_006791 [Varicellaria rhodocarpa]|nr:hypothetical protein [Varicellaria rhodocarpa]